MPLPHHLSRRFFLQSSGALAAYLGVSPLLGSLPRGLALQPVARNKTLVIIFLRGGADGLNLVVPFADPHYARLRPTLAIPTPGQGPDAAIDLNGFFGLHPRLGALKPLFDSDLACALHAVGYDKNTRSHFEEQDTWETGIVGNTVASDGWLNRHLATSTGHGRIRAVAIGDTLPRIMRGKASAYALRGVEDLAPPETPGMDRAKVTAGLEHAYCTPKPADRDSARDLLAHAAGETLEAMNELRAVSSTKYQPKKPYPETDLGRRLKEVARLIHANVGLEVAEVDFGGWDTHQSQGGAQGQQANLAIQLAEALAAFSADLEDRMDDLLVVTLTDFGRTAAENGTGGTDHGWANCMLALGGAVKTAAAKRSGPDKRVITKWPGLAPDQLHEGRDLLHTTDFRDVIAEMVKVHLGNPSLETVIPGRAFAPVGIVS